MRSLCRYSVLPNQPTKLYKFVRNCCLQKLTKYFYKFYKTINSVHTIFLRYQYVSEHEIFGKPVLGDWLSLLAFPDSFCHAAFVCFYLSDPSFSYLLCSLLFFSSFKYLHQCTLLFGDGSRGHAYQRVDIQQFLKNSHLVEFPGLAFVCWWRSYSYFYKANCMLFCGLRSFLCAWQYISVLALLLVCME